MQFQRLLSLVLCAALIASSSPLSFAATRGAATGTRGGTEATRAALKTLQFESGTDKTAMVRLLDQIPDLDAERMPAQLKDLLDATLSDRAGSLTAQNLKDFATVAKSSNGARVLPGVDAAAIADKQAQLSSGRRHRPSAPSERQATDALNDSQAPTAPAASLPADAPAQADSALPPAVAARIVKSFSANFKALLAKRPTIGFGKAKGLPIIGMPNVGDNFAEHWTNAASQADRLLIAAYNFDDMDMAKTIVAAIKSGKQVVFVGDYSNWFPKPAPGGGHGADPRTEAMKYLLANKNENLQLLILKGLGGISGINHNKFTVMSLGQGASLEEIAQTGSFNYTKTSQNNHFENFGFTNDKDRVAFLKNYHAWLVRRAKAFHEGMTEAEAEPTFPANDPIPEDASRLSAIPFPKEVGTPKSQAGKWYVQFYEQAKQDVFGAMFAMFPTPEEVAAIEAKLAAKIPVTFIVDHGQVERAGALWGLIQKGMKLLVMAGPEKVIYGLPQNPEHSKLHMKVVAIDGGKAAKGNDSLNDSKNAEQHNFENLGFWEGYIAQFLYTYIREVMVPLASPPTQQLLQKLEAEFNHAQTTAGTKP